MKKAMSECRHGHDISSVYQTIDELDFERGIWSAAQSNDIAKVLNFLHKGSHVNQTDKAGYTALHYASRNGHFDMCKLLLSHNADVNSLTKAGRVSCLHRSASSGHLDIFKLLLKFGAKTNLRDSDGKTVLHRAAESNHESIVNIILEIDPQLAQEPDNRGRLPVHLTKSDKIKILLNDVGVSKENTTIRSK